MESQREFGPFVIDFQERTLRKGGQPVALTPKAFDVLAALLEQPGRLFTKQELLDKVWPDTFVEESNLTYNVFSLRKALGDPAENGQYIETVPRRGYRFTGALTSLSVNHGNPQLAGAGGGLNAASAVEPHRFQPVDPPVAIADPAAGSTGPVQTPAPARLRWRPSRSVLAMSVSVAIAASLLVYWWTESKTSEPLRAIPLTSMPGVVRSPSLSPDGTHVVFTWTGTRQDNPDLYVQQIAAGPAVRLTTDPGNDYSPSWSPDGRTIAYLHRGPDSGPSDVRLIAPLGGPERTITQIQPRLAFFRPPSVTWCPDSKCVLTADAAGDGPTDAVFAIFLDSGERRQLTHPPNTRLDADPAIAPDGRTLIFRRDSTPFAGEFHRVALSERLEPDGEPVRLTETLRAGKPAWLPDGREFVFGARGALWRLDPFSGNAPTRLPFVGQDGQSPVVARTADRGWRLAYVRSFADGNIWRVDMAPAGATAISPPMTAIGSTRFDGIPSLSPDGERVTFVSNRSGESEIWVSSADGSNAFVATSLGVDPGFPRWSPDGTSITFHGDPRARPDVMVMPAQGGRPRIMETGKSNAAYPSFSRDGKWIYFAYVEAGESRIWKLPASGGAAVQVTDNAGTIGVESYDGHDLYYVSSTDRPGSIWRLPLAGGPSVKLVDGIASGAFDVAEQGIYYIDRVSGGAGVFFTDRPGGETRLRYFDFATAQSTTIVRDLGAVFFGLSASRDGRKVLFTRIDSSIDEVLVVDNFR